MIRKSTWIALAVFIVVLAIVIGVNQSSKSAASLITPSPTPAAKAIPSETLVNLLDFSYIDVNNNVLNITMQKDGNWSFSSNPGKKINQARVTEIISNLTSLTAISSMEPSVKAEDLGLSPAARKLTLRSKQGTVTTISIGNLTPTGSGYYFQVDDGTPVIVGKGGLETIMDLLTAENLTIQLTNTPD